MMTTNPIWRLSSIIASLLGLGLLLAGCMMGGGMRGGGVMGGMMGGGMRGENISPPPVLTPLPTATPGGTTAISYREDIQPIFNQNCTACHGGLGELWLNGYDYVLAGSSQGPVIVPGNPEASELYRRISGQSRPAMPLNGAPLQPAEIEIIADWIAEGAPNN